MQRDSWSVRPFSTMTSSSMVSTRPNLSLVFFERGVVDAFGMLNEIGVLPHSELQAFLLAYPYHRQVFLFPPWEAIYANDAERDQTFVEAARVYRGASEWYQRCGHEVVDVPRLGVAERCTYILQALGAAA
jgi:predicted ATPase